jgi:malonyl-ACP decarboxylase
MSPERLSRGGRAVVTGMGVICSIAPDVDSFSKALRLGCCGIEPNPWGEDGPPFGAVIRGFNYAAALANRKKLPEQLLEAAERAARRAPFPLQVAAAATLEAWEGAHLHEMPVGGDRLGLIVAGNNLTSRYADTLRPSFEQNRLYLPGRFALQFQDTDHVGTLSEILGVTGEGFTVGGASASGNLGIINASRLVESGAVDACLVTGALTDLSAMEMHAYLNVGAMACQPGDDGPRTAGPPFDGSHRGFVPGQGCASLVLESVSSAARRGVTVLAEVGAYAINLDANRLADPSQEGEAKVMGSTIRRAGLEPRDISYVNAHGSGSELGDEIEVGALRRVFEGALGVPWINATKSLTGHCLATAGVLEAVATVIQMQEGFVHPNVGLRQPIDAECRFVGARAESATIRFALSNSFGFGGINTSILLARPNGPAVPAT